jgi:hypothetical protein
LREKTIPRREALVSRAINTVGMVVTGSVLIIVTITKFKHGAWLVFAAMPIIIWVMNWTRKYYHHMDIQIRADGKTEFGASGDHAIVLVGRLHKPALKALDYAISADHKSLEAVHIDMGEGEKDKLKRAWKRQNILVPLTIVPSPYREVSTPLIGHIRTHRETHGSEVITVYLPQYVYGHWWEGFLHNRRTLRIRNRLMLFPGVEVTLVPWLLDSSKALYARPARPLPGQARRGEPIAPPRLFRNPQTPKNGIPAVRNDGTLGNTRNGEPGARRPGRR